MGTDDVILILQDCKIHVNEFATNQPHRAHYDTLGIPEGFVIILWTFSEETIIMMVAEDILPGVIPKYFI